MRFVTNPQLILSLDEFETLDGALKLCRDMDEETGATSCETCPFESTCSCTTDKCVYAIAHKELKKIIDVAIVK